MKILIDRRNRKIWATKKQARRKQAIDYLSRRLN